MALQDFMGLTPDVGATLVVALDWAGTRPSVPTNVFLMFICNNDKFCVRRILATDNRNKGAKRKQFSYLLYVLRCIHLPVAAKIHFPTVVACKNIKKVFVRHSN
jgi:hypothetical protein